LCVASEVEVQVKYKEFVVGRHRLDLLVEDTVIVELKAAHGIVEIYLAQALSYIKATKLPIALIINCGESSLTWKRLIKTRT
jgi:GxxExxY protein